LHENDFVQPRPGEEGCIMTGLLDWIDALSERSGRLICYLVPILAAIEGYEVVVRYGLHSPTIWAHELSAMIFGAFTLLGGAYTLRTGGHVNMDVLYNLLPTRLRALMDILTFFLFLAFVGVLMVKGWEMAWRSITLLEHDSTQWAPPLFPFKLTLPIGAALLLLQGLAKLVRDVRTLIRGKD
jgi:TRAP-type mannitol/chloroaromatic compound transport system permease small subunit